jgi:hypothetical protein
MILAKLRTAMLAAIPGLDAPKTALFRVARKVVGRLNLQPVAPATDQTKDLSNVEVCPGVPGVTSDPTDGETPIVALVGADGAPYVIARASESMPGHTPLEVRHDATTAIRLISKASSTGAKVYVGATPTFPLARAADLASLLASLQAAAATMSASVVPEVVAVGGILSGALSGNTVTPTAKLEAE